MTYQTRKCATAGCPAIVDVAPAGEPAATHCAQCTDHAALMLTRTKALPDRPLIWMWGSTSIGWVRHSPAHRGFRVMFTEALGRACQGVATHKDVDAAIADLNARVRAVYGGAS